MLKKYAYAFAFWRINTSSLVRLSYDDLSEKQMTVINIKK